MPRIFFGLLLLIVALNPESAIAQPSELAMATRSGNLERVRELLAAGVDPDQKAVASPIYFAAQAGRLEIVEALLDHGANPNVQTPLGTPLHVAARRGHLEIAIDLLQHGADTNLVGGEFANTPLHEAALKGAVEIGDLLIGSGADVNARNKQFEPPIHLAVKKGRTDFAALLLKSGATAIIVEPISDALADADLEMGRIRALECSVCHQLSKDKNSGGDGPRLWGVVGRPIASLTYDYSDALKAQSGNWTYERLSAFLADPAGYIPGNGMYRGYVEDRIERTAVIAYLRTLSDDPIPLP